MEVMIRCAMSIIQSKIRRMVSTEKKSQSSVQSIFVRCENCKKSVNTRPKRGDRFNLIALYAYRVNSMLYCKLNFPNNLSWRYGVRELIWLP